MSGLAIKEVDFNLESVSEIPPANLQIIKNTAIEMTSSLVQANLPKIEITAAVQLFKINLQKLQTTEISHSSDPQRTYLTIANTIRELALQRIFQGPTPKNISITIIPPSIEHEWSWEEHLIKPTTIGAAAALGGTLVAGGPVGVGVGILTVLGYGTYKTVQWLTKE